MIISYFENKCEIPINLSLLFSSEWVYIINWPLDSPHSWKVLPPGKDFSQMQNAYRVIFFKVSASSMPLKIKERLSEPLVVICILCGHFLVHRSSHF